MPILNAFLTLFFKFKAHQMQLFSQHLSSIENEFKKHVMKLPEDERRFHSHLLQHWAVQVAKDPSADISMEKYSKESMLDFSIQTDNNEETQKK